MSAAQMTTTDAQALRSALTERVEVHKSERDSLLIDCPLCSSDLYLSSSGSVACSQGCDAGEATYWLRQIARRLPRNCSKVLSGYHAPCPQCIDRAEALRLLARDKAAFVRGGSDSGGADPFAVASVDAPTSLHQTRLDYHQADRWARRRVDAEEAAAGDDGSAWAPASLDDTEPLPSATVMEIGAIEGGSGTFLVRSADVVNVHGQPGAGKTPLAYLVVAQEVRRGHLALIVDYEMGKRPAVALLDDLGLTADELREGVYYVSSPPLLTPVGRSRMIKEIEARAAATGRTLTVGVVDSLTKSMTRLPGVSDNDAQDVAKWYSDLPHWLRDQFGLTVIVIDHSGVNDGPRPSGSHKKKEEADHHFWLHKESAFSRKRPEDGKASLVVVKDRSGDTAEEEEVAVLRTVSGGSFYLAPPGSAGAGPVHGDIEVPLDLMKPSTATEVDVLEDLRRAEAAGLFTVEVTGTGDAGTYRRKALKRLESTGVVVSHREGKGVRWWAVEFAPVRVSS